MKIISSIEVLCHGTLRLNWKGGGWNNVTLMPWMKKGRKFERISDRSVFCTASVSDDGNHVLWNSVRPSMSVEACMSYAKAYEKSCRKAIDEAERRAENQISEINNEVAMLGSPIKVGEIDESDITYLLEDRLESLLFLHQVEPTADSWKDLALQLAVIIKMGGKYVGGRNLGINVEFPAIGYNSNIICSMYDMINRSGVSQKQAAESVAKEYKCDPSTLESRYSEAKKKGIEFAPEARALGQVMAALGAAADRLEDAHRAAEGPVQPDGKLQT